MRIEFIGHAGFVVEGASETLIMDPWLSDTGAFDSSWFQYPCNHHLDREVIGRLRSADRPCYLYISHEHKDHLDQPFLERLVEYQPTLIVAAFQEQHFINSLRALGFARIIVAEDGQPVRANKLGLKLFIDDSGMNRDSAILVKETNFSFLNLNDCKIYDRLHQIRQANGPINVLACQFSGASWHPTCYAYSPEEYVRIATQKRFSKFRSVLQAIETVSPDWYFPSAGPPCFLDPDLLHLNFERVNIFPQQSAIIDYLRRRKAPCKTEALMPGDVFDSTVKRFTRQAPQLVTPGSEEAYIRQYAAKFSHLWDAQKRVRSTEACKVILGRLEGELARKLSVFPAEDVCGRNIFFGLRGLEREYVCIDFARREVLRTFALPDDGFYHVEAPAWQVERVLDHSITWEDFCLTFRARFSRAPDIYDTLMTGFVLNEAEAIPELVAKVTAFRQNKERIVVEVAGQQFEINRYCPHQGADLSYGWCEDDRYWVCARHRWKFDMESGGRCTAASDSVNALSLEAES